MRRSFYSEIPRQLLFTVFPSSKPKKTDIFRIHHHTELELGYIVSGEGEYHLGGEVFDIRGGDLILVRSNEQHCVPTITSDELVSFNIQINPLFLWKNCVDYIDPAHIRALFDTGWKIRHHFEGFSERMDYIRCIVGAPDENRFEIRRRVLDLIIDIMSVIGLDVEYGIKEDMCISNRVDDIQKALQFIDMYMMDRINLDDIAKAANMSRSHLSAHFKMVTGISPYEYLILRRIENAAVLLIETDETIMSIAQKTGFGSQVNLDKAFKKTAGISPRDYRISHRQQFGEE